MAATAGLALRDQLKLTDDQVKELETIATATQEQVKTKLTAEQLTALEVIAATPHDANVPVDALDDRRKALALRVERMMCPMMSASSSTAAKGQAHTGMMCCPMVSH